MEILDEAECLRLLAGCPIGRVAVSIGAMPAVFPVNFAVLDSMVVFRTGQGTKLDAAVKEAVVAFEVDDVDPLYHLGWSVVVVGVAHEVREPTLLRKVQALPLTPWASGQKDHFVCLRPELVTGRRIVHSVGGGMAAAGV